MGIIDRLDCQEEWNRFLEYKQECKHLSKQEEADLQEFIHNKEYKETVEKIRRGILFAPPKKAIISKMHSNKKRIVYTYSREENYVLKLITYLLRDYDDCFSDNLYSFRKNRGVKMAVHTIVNHPGIDDMYSYKVDISNYFNSVNVEILIPFLKKVLWQDPALFQFIAGLLKNPYVEDRGKIITESKGIMAGTPVSTFLANLYLRELDEYFFRENRIYARYSDDIIIFADTEEKLDEYIQCIKDILSRYELEVNPDKEIRTGPREKWSFLGISYCSGTIDISDISVMKMKKKMRRKARALLRWQARKGVSGESTVRAFIRSFNRKLFENPNNHELTWTRWYFPLINSTEGLKQIDHYMQQQIRYIAAGKHSKRGYDFRYSDMKRCGYISLTAEYYKSSKY